MKVVVVGAGKMGLPLACQFAKNGANVVACDVDQALVDTINRGEPPFDEPDLPELLHTVIGSGNLRANTNTAGEAHDADVIVIIVPALLTSDHDIDASRLEDVTQLIAPIVKNGVLVSYETTVPVGFTRSHFLPIFEQHERAVGRDVHVAFSPERVKSRFVFRNLTVNPKVVGGCDAATATMASAFYSRYLGAPVNNVGSLEAAEMVKVAGMVYRDVNIALANELATYAERAGVDLRALMPSINSDGEAHLLEAGIGVGGHCTPVYPYFMIRDAERRGVSLSIVERGRIVNDEQPARVVNRAESLWGSFAGKQVCILGAAFRPDVKEHICSPVFPLVESLLARGADVRVVDPLYCAEELRALGLPPGRLAPDAPADVVIVQVAHRAFAALSPDILKACGVSLVVDGRHLYSALDIEAVGLRYLGVGMPSELTRAAITVPKPLPIARPLLEGREVEAASRVVRSGWIMQGPEVAAFECEFAAFVGAEHACAVSSGTAALHLSLLALGIGPGDEVITASHSFIATANAIALTGATPVFVDIDPHTYNVHPALVEQAVTPKTRAVMCVHQLGLPCDLRALRVMCASRKIHLVEDAACAIGAEIDLDTGFQRIGRPAGVVACFSFHPRKILTTGDGGMVTTNNAKVAAKIRLLRGHGMATPDSPAEVVAYNYRLTDIQAAIGREQLRRVPELVAERRAQRQRYDIAFANVDPKKLTRAEEPVWARGNAQSYCVVLGESIDRANVRAALGASGISTRGGVMNAHEEPAYAAYKKSLPHSERVKRQGLILPLYPRMTAQDQKRVADALIELL